MKDLFGNVNRGGALAYQGQDVTKAGILKILVYYGINSVGSFVKYFLPLLGKDMRMGNNNQYPPLPSLIREGVSNSHPELVSGFHKKLKHRVQSSVYKMLKQVQHDINLLKRTYSLINLFSYSPRKRCAFTLAEVLITLGVIGVVAAMTLPSLIADYKEKELVTRAKRSYSVIMNAINAYNADNVYKDYRKYGRHKSNCTCCITIKAD